MVIFMTIEIGTPFYSQGNKISTFPSILIPAGPSGSQRVPTQHPPVGQQQTFLIGRNVLSLRTLQAKGVLFQGLLPLALLARPGISQLNPTHPMGSGVSDWDLNEYVW